MGAAVIVLLYNIYRTLKGEVMKDQDPWNAFTLEWYADAPPGERNFVDVPVVTSRRPFYDLKNPHDRDYD
jgi:heme/copper-type cytochrome/quinol oxidase subunit 1